jgi:hypothetical protein
MTHQHEFIEPSDSRSREGEGVGEGDEIDQTLPGPKELARYLIALTPALSLAGEGDEDCR